MRPLKSSEALTAGDRHVAQGILDILADYNRDDCVSNLRLRDWLIALGDPPSTAASQPQLRTVVAVTHPPVTSARRPRLHANVAGEM